MNAVVAPTHNHLKFLLRTGSDLLEALILNHFMRMKMMNTVIGPKHFAVSLYLLPKVIDANVSKMSFGLNDEKIFDLIAHNV